MLFETYLGMCRVEILMSFNTFINFKQGVYIVIYDGNFLHLIPKQLGDFKGGKYCIVIDIVNNCSDLAYLIIKIYIII